MPAAPWGQWLDAEAQALGIVEHDPRFADVAQPLANVPIETARNQTPHGPRRRCREGRPVNVLPQDRGERVRNRLSLERSPP